jgi:hypothetical protein
MYVYILIYIYMYYTYIQPIILFFKFYIEFKMLAFVPEDPWVQLRMAMEAVFGSWFSPRAISYRYVQCNYCIYVYTYTYIYIWPWRQYLGLGSPREQSLTGKWNQYFVHMITYEDIFLCNYT